MSKKRVVILPDAIARDIVQKSIKQFSGTEIGFDGHITLFDLGLTSRSSIIDLQKAIARELAKAAPRHASANRFARHLRIGSDTTGEELLRRLQKAYALGLSGDVLPPDYDLT